MTIISCATKENANLILEIPSIQTFKAAVEGRIPYDSQHPAIEYWEDFLVFWMMGDEIENKEIRIQMVFKAFRDSFSYSGTLWRGMWVKNNEPLYPLDIACFTDEEEVALYFAGASRVYGYYHEEVEAGVRQVLIEVKANRALALDDLMNHLLTKTTHLEFPETVEKRDWEREKLYPLTEEDLRNAMMLVPTKRNT